MKRIYTLTITKPRELTKLFTRMYRGEIKIKSIQECGYLGDVYYIVKIKRSSHRINGIDSFIH